MALRRQSLSPTANLLRNSRLFSLPNPLPRPQVSEGYGAGTVKVSDSATLPYPTHQAIATTPKSLARGDWGLKRPLPSRSHLVQTSSPVVKVKQLDTIEHITDFDSAADHVRTRQKFEELSIPMMKGVAAMRDQASTLPTTGAFESWSDVTSYEEDKGLDEAGKMLEAIKISLQENAKPKGKNSAEHAWTPSKLPEEDRETATARHNARRWKHEGPWVPGMSADEFTKFMTKELSARKGEFHRYLRHYAKSDIFTARKVASSNQTIPDNPLDHEMHLEQQESKEYSEQMHREWSNISEEEIDARIKKLRSEAAFNPLRSRLVQNLIVPFLRIPSIKLKDTTYSVDGKSDETAKYRFDDDVAPLSTHPSAGLGYLRTNAHMSNHPILGPQGLRAPVQARVIEARSASRQNAARLGVAGFVTNDDYKGYHEKPGQHQVNRDPAFEIDVHTEGGRKISVLPRFGSVTNNGRIHIKLDRAVGAEVQVANGALEDRPPERTVTEESPSDMLMNLSKMGQSGTELDEKSAQAQQFMQFAADPEANPFAGSNSKDFASVDETQSFDEMRPGVEEAIRGEDETRRR